MTITPIEPPENIDYGTVVWQAATDVGDGSDPGSLPDYIPPTGTVTFVSSVGKLLDPGATPNPITIIRDVILGVIDEQGYLCTPDPVTLQPAYRGVKLIANDDEDLNPRNSVYNVAYQLKSGRTGKTLKYPEQHQISVIAGQTVDLTNFIVPDNPESIGLPQANALAAQAAASAVVSAAEAAEAKLAAQGAEAALVDSTTFVNGVMEADPEGVLAAKIEAEVDPVVTALGTKASASALAAEAGNRTAGDAATLAAIPAAVTAGIAADGTVAAAAAAAAPAAVNAELATRSGLPVTRADTDPDMARWRSKIGRRFLFAVSKAGVLRAAGIQVVGGGVTRKLNRSDYLKGTRIFVPGVTHPYLAQDVLLGNGLVPLSTLIEWETRRGWAPATVKGRSITAAGDSMVSAAFGGGQSTPNHIGTLTGLPVFERGFPGETSKAVALRHAGPISIDTDVTIPASGSTAAFAVNGGFAGFGWSNGSTEQGVPDGTTETGWVGGVYCRMRGGSGQVILDRLRSGGEAVTVPAGSVWVSEFASSRRFDNLYINHGRNNISDVAQVLAADQAIIGFQLAGDYIVTSVCNATSEPAGSADYNKIMAINTARAAAHGAHYWDKRAWMVNNALVALGLAPTSDDMTARDEDRLPPQILAPDGKHFNALGYKAEAIGATTVPMTTRKWF